jgi:hypothetical protein
MDEMQAVVVAAQTREENIVIASTPLMLCNGTPGLLAARALHCRCRGWLDSTCHRP